MVVMHVKVWRNIMAKNTKNKKDKLKYKSFGRCPQCEVEDALNKHGLCSHCQKLNDKYDEENPY